MRIEIFPKHSMYGAEGYHETDSAATIHGHGRRVPATRNAGRNFRDKPSVPSFESGSAGSRSSTFILESALNFGSVVIVSLLLTDRSSFETDNGVIEEMGIEFSPDVSL